MVARTIVGLTSETAEAEQVVNELVDGGFSRDDISLVAHRARCGPSVGPVESVSSGGRPGTGAAIGGLAGFVTGIVALAVPGVGPILAAGPIAAELLAGGIGATAGAMIGGLKRMGVSDEDAGCFCEAVRRGGILISVVTADERASEAERIIGKHRLVDIDDCAAEWRQSGWNGFDPDAEPTDRGEPMAGLPFAPDSLRPSVRRARRERRAVRQYFRVR
jgi:hypothetical protein